MQLYALDEKDEIISAESAQKQRDYRCLECASCVRLRSGSHRKRHFYHLEPNRSCRLHQKGAVHLQLQTYFYRHLPEGDCQLEYRMPAIGRIADVVWFSKKIVFEIQYSPITAEEVNRRNLDYQRLGWTVVWILHERRFNHIRLSAAEHLLRYLPHYFTNMNSQGDGIIYDQFDLIYQGMRRDKMGPLAVDFTQPCPFLIDQKGGLSLERVRRRAEHSPYFFAGDLSDLELRKREDSYIQNALQKEMAFTHNEQLRRVLQRECVFRRLANVIFKRPYQFVFRLLLERTCR
ncbi:putative transcription factor [Candidatus Protochlamydia naegleriophila]|uniref:Putative transcription factor n=1 Tax=Candidatus Protochlamydia naegleriophila TaxID=389348 RepID=A0A0U5J9M8_9BACT|nr:competence protein CoiA family protein [Candidatus Protochlamydia naegleriophila]CUI15815.1 putative transcription factor [Candidatus Protochlamydia naegleriophila]